MPFTYHDPYAGCGGNWIRGNFHHHCKEHSGCSRVHLMDGLAYYRAVGARFVALTDHDHVTDPTDAAGRFPQIAFLRGFEYSSSENMLFIGEDVPKLYRLPIHEALGKADGLLTVICHPRPFADKDYWTLPRILALPRRPDGIEVFNGHYSTERMRRKGGNPLYADVWDELLTRGWRIWGFANDDFHEPEDFSNAFDMVSPREPTPRGILEAARSGRFYGTTGLLLKGLEFDGGVLSVRTETPAEGRFLGPGGRVLSAASGTDFRHGLSGEAYVRFEAEGDKGRLFLQPYHRT